MSSRQKQDFLVFLRKMSKKGFYDILKYIEDVEEIHYNDVLRYALDKNIIDSRASITIILNGLTDLDLLERNVMNTKPVRTTYKVSKKGHFVIKTLKELETVFLK